MKARSADLWSGLALGALGAYIAAQASGWEYLGQDGPGPGFFPLWYGVAMVALSLGLVASSLRSNSTDTIDWSGSGRAFAIWAALVVAVAALKLVGFLVSIAALSFFIVAVLYRRPFKVGAAVAILMAAAFYLVFALALGVRLP